MSRRDTILTAVLINIGLLVILFTTAFNSNEAEQAIATTPPPLSPPIAKIEPDLTEKYVVQESAPPVPAPKPIAKPTPPPAPTPAAPPAPEEPAFTTVTVKKGDSLDKIARANDTTIDDLMEANNLASSVLQIGQKLEVPLAKKKVVRRRRISTDTAKTEDFYTIKSGDNPWSIAMKHRIPLDELLALNDLNESTARKLKPGDRIRIK